MAVDNNPPTHNVLVGQQQIQAVFLHVNHGPAISIEANTPMKSFKHNKELTKEERFRLRSQRQRRQGRCRCPAEIPLKFR